MICDRQSGHLFFTNTSHMQKWPGSRQYCMSFNKNRLRIQTIELLQGKVLFGDAQEAD